VSSMYRASLKKSHPRGVYRRSGRAFTEEPVLLCAEEITEAMRADPWLVIEEVEGADEEPGWATGARELRGHIESLEDAASVQAILDWERSTRMRRTVIRAAEARLNELAGATSPERKDQD
jgi:hypothetical protein